MLNVILCEDNKKQRERFENIIKTASQNHSLDAHLAVSTDDPQEVIKYLEISYKSPGIYFLDIDLQADVNGLELAKLIRQYDNNGYIVFITTHSEMTPLVFKYKVEAMDFIIKDDLGSIRNKIVECLVEACNKELGADLKRNDYISIESGNKLINIDLNKLIYLETSDKTHKIRLHTLDSQIEFYGTMKDLEGMLNDNFYRIHRSFIVNLKKIKEVDKNKLIVYMINGGTCYISIRYMKGFLNRWKE